MAREQVALYVARAVYAGRVEWRVCMAYPYDAWLAVFGSRLAAEAAVAKLYRCVHWCLQPDKLAKLPDVRQVNIGLADY